MEEKKEDYNNGNIYRYVYLFRGVKGSYHHNILSLITVD